MICESVTDINIMQARRQDGNKTIGTTNTIMLLDFFQFIIKQYWIL